MVLVAIIVSEKANGVALLAAGLTMCAGFPVATVYMVSLPRGEEVARDTDRFQDIVWALIVAVFG